jgi:small GTP-binding protein
MISFGKENNPRNMERLDTQLSQMKEIAATVAARELITEITDLKEKLQRERLYRVVLGLFKRGKSSLLNALLGKELLPVAVTPLTAIITLLEFTAGEPFAEVEFRDGHRERKKPEEIRFYVGEEENPDNKKQVSVVRVYDHSPLLKLVSLVDTPGLGSAFEHNTATTLQFVPKIDAALFVLSADMPVSKPEIDFLNDLKEVVPRILFVMNKIDLLSEADLKKMVVHNASIISKLLGKALSEKDLMLVSSLQPGSSLRENGITGLKQFIESIAVNEKDRLLQQSARKQYGWLHNRLQMLLQLKLDTLTMPLQELEQKQARLSSSILLMQQQKDEFESIINGKISQLQDQIRSTVNMESKTIRSTIYQKLDENQQDILNTQEFKAIQAGLNEFILNHFNSVKDNLEDATREQFKNLLHQYSNRSQSFLNELANHLKTLMGISFDMIAGQFDLNIYTSFYLSLDSGTGTVAAHQSLLNKFLPASIRKKALLRRLREYYDAIIIRNSSSIGYDLQYKIQESFRKFSYDLNNRLADLMANIESIITATIESKNKKAYLLDNEIEDLKKDLGILNSIKNM